MNTAHAFQMTEPERDDLLDERCHDYERMARALEWLGENFESQPSLREAAAAAGMSEFHFQRCFSRWAGVSPKQYVGYLTLASAKRSLAEERSVLDAAYDAGLSGPGRLHDLFVSIDALTPGEYKARGAGLTLRHGCHPTPFGAAVVVGTGRGICGIGFVAGRSPRDTLDALCQGLERAARVEDEATTARLAADVFGRLEAGGEPRPLRLLLRGSPFQIKVWEALLAVPAGALTSYGDLARRVGRPSAVRAVANAVAANPIAWLIPCHRVIRRHGALGGYRWGAGRKLAMLSREMAPAAAPL